MPTEFLHRGKTPPLQWMSPMTLHLMIKLQSWSFGYYGIPFHSHYFYVHWARHAGHCCRSRDELISDVLLWTPTYGRAKAGRPARTYIQQLCEDTGCSPEDLPEAMNDREKWRERVSGTTWWWWWWWHVRVPSMGQIELFMNIKLNY